MTVTLLINKLRGFESVHRLVHSLIADPAFQVVMVVFSKLALNRPIVNIAKVIRLKMKLQQCGCSHQQLDELHERTEVCLLSSELETNLQTNTPSVPAAAQVKIFECLR